MITLSVQQSQRDTADPEDGAAVDSASLLKIQTDPEFATLTAEPNLYLDGIVPLHYLGSTGYLLVPHHGLQGKACDLQVGDERKGHPVPRSHLQGKKDNHQYGGTITLPDGTVIVMIYHKGIWRLPMLTRQKAAALHQQSHIRSIKSSKSPVLNMNPYSTLLKLAYEVEPVRESTTPANIECMEEVDKKLMQLIQNKWGHPSNSKMERIVLYYKCHGFLKGFLAALKKFKCK
eukprot:3018182-Rhodomonas_salina.1